MLASDFSCFHVPVPCTYAPKYAPCRHSLVQKPLELHKPHLHAVRRTAPATGVAHCAAGIAKLCHGRLGEPCESGPSSTGTSHLRCEHGFNHIHGTSIPPAPYAASMQPWQDVTEECDAVRSPSPTWACPLSEVLSTCPLRMAGYSLPVLV